jgi:amino acid adenylation domain-containing protein/non-ribosomal peptide synthase protein (TIGR01720 family)
MIDESPHFDDLALLDALLSDAEIERPHQPEIRRTDTAVPRMSRAQRRIWFLQQVAGASPVYTTLSAVLISGHLQLDALRRSLREIVRRHDVLRYCFPLVDGQPIVALRHDWEMDIAVDELGALDSRPRRELIAELCAAEASRAFDLARGPLLRLRLVRLAEREHLALLGLHHVVTDGWSMGVLLAELGALYQAFIEGRRSPLPELAQHYADFVAWQEWWLGQDAAQQQRRWWLERLAALAPLELPTDRPRPAQPSHRGAVHAVSLPRAVAGALAELGRRESATLFMTLLAAFAVLLHRYTGQDDIVVGSAVANRNRREFEPLIGLFVNSLVMRCDLSGQPAFLDVLRRVRNFTGEALARQDLPFEELVKALAPERHGSANPLFQVMFSLETAAAQPFRLPGLTLTPVEVANGAAKFDLLLNVTAGEDGGLSAAFEYATDLFDAATVVRMAGHFTSLVGAIVADPAAPIATLPMLSHQECQQLADWNDAVTSYPRDDGLASLFERQARSHPDAIAVEFGATRLSYGALNASANRLARRLRACGVVLETPVAIHARRSADWIVGLLAIIKAGGAYVPLDPSYPRQRRELMLADCGAAVVLSDRDADALAVGARIQLSLQDTAGASDEADGDPDWPRAGGGNLAYVTYTSGSTGQPKGVAVPHRAVSRLVINTNYIALQPDDIVAQASNASFDAATFEVWGALLNGARLVGIEREVLLAPLQFAAVLHDQRVTTLFLTTALFNRLADETPDAFGSLRCLMVGGEQLDPRRIRQVLRHAAPTRLLNVYGPTENTTFSSWKEIRDVPAEMKYIPIGRAISNTTLHVLDRNRQVLPVGIPGELYLGGDGLACGYHGLPDETARRFVANPFDHGRTRLYRSGDVVRLLADGDIEILGRSDHQIKIRGYRVEPEEIETALLRQAGVQEAVVLAREDRPGQRELVAYVVGASGPALDPARLRQDLADLLPAYMVPSRFMVLPALPLNANGKLDRTALPVPAANRDRPDAPRLPRDSREQCLAGIWQDVLGCQQPGIDDNYFDLGGDSIAAILVASRLKRAGWQLEIRDLFQNPTIAGLAPRLVAVESGAATSAPLFGPVPLSATQRWLFQHHPGALHHFNQAVMLQPNRPIEAALLRRALDGLWNHHDALRANFHRGVDGTLSQHVAPQSGFAGFELCDLSHEVDPIPRLSRTVEAAHAGFDLAQGALLKVVLFHLPDGQRLLIVAHHLVIDGVSWRILLEDLETLYAQGELAPRTASVRDWAELQADFVADPSSSSEAEYWRGILTAIPPRPPHPAPIWGAVRMVARRLSMPCTAALVADAHKAFRTEITDLLLAALANALTRWDGEASHLVTLEGHGRESLHRALDLTRTVGWFTSIFPIVLVGAAERGLAIRRTKEMLRRVPHKGAGFLPMTELGTPVVSVPRSRISFNYLGRFADDVAAAGGAFGFAPESSGEPIAAWVPRRHDLDITALVSGEAMQLSIHFDPCIDPAERVDALLAGLADELDAVCEHCLARAAPERTPSDLIAGHLFDIDSYQEFLAQHRWAAAEIEEVAPLTPLQEGLLIQAQLDPDPSSYFIQVAFTLSGQVESAAIAASWEALMRRYPLLCTIFVHGDGPRALQVVLKDRLPVVVVEDWSDLSPAAQRSREANFRNADLAGGFDLERDPPLRIAVFALAHQRYRIVWSFHHIVLDAWSLGILYHDWLDLLQGRELPPAFQQTEFLRGIDHRDATESERYWRSRLEGYDSLATLPRLRPSQRGRRYQLREVGLELDAATTARLRDLAAQQGATLGTAILALWGLLLARYNGTADVAFGTVVSGRSAAIAGIDRMVGLFINTIPLRLQIPDQCSFAALVRGLQSQWLAGEPHHGYPLSEILALGPLGRDTFDHLLTIENAPWDRQVVDEAGLSVGDVSYHDRPHYDFFVVAVPGDRLSLAFKYNADVFDPDQIERLAGHVDTLLHAALAAPDDPALSLELLPEQEREAVLHQFNATAAPSAADIDLVARLEQQAGAIPEAVAVRFGQKTLTFRELSARADGIAALLKSHPGVVTETRIGLHMDRSEWLAAALWGILKAGAAFVPIDPDDPGERARFIVRDAGCPVVMTDPHYADIYRDLPGVMVLDPRASVGWPAPAPRPGHRPDALAYVIFTSGTTGTPKGVMIEHRQLAHYIAWAAGRYDPQHRGAACALQSSLGFDLTITSLFLPVFCGQALHVFAQDRDPRQILAESLAPAAGIDILKLTPSHISLLKDMELPQTGVRVAIVGGEALLPEQVASLERLNPAMQIYNEYGPTEATVGCVVRQVRGSDARVLIGRPIDNTTIYILDGAMRPVPVGVAGELYIGGAGVARGYLNRPELTAARFLPSPFRVGERLFRTGDVGRWLPNGEIDFLGRNDHQIKLRGHRIELAEIESCLLAHPAVSGACVTARSDGSGGKAIVAYVVVAAPEAATEAKLRRHLRERLPDYMIPAWLVAIERLPLTVNGKIDHRRLPHPEGNAGVAGLAPRTETERRLHAIWSAVLGRSDLGVDSNFFDFGGHSLKALQITGQIHRILGVQVALRQLFDHPTIAELSRLIDTAARAEVWAHIPAAPQQEHYELSHAQRRLWMMHQLEGATAYNMPEAYLVETEIDASILERAFARLIRRHEALRTAFVIVDGEPRQRILPDVPFAIRLQDLRTSPDADAQARAIAEQDANQPFELASPPLLRVSLARLPERRSLLVLTMHHIVGDGWSGNLVFSELLNLYDACGNGRPDPLRPLRIQYKDFAAWQNARDFRSEQDYWVDRLRGMAESIRLPYDFAPEAVRDFTGANRSLDLGGEVLAGLRRLAARRRHTLSSVTLALFNLLLFRWTGQHDLCIGMSVANRNHPDLEPLIGFFVNVLPLRCTLSADMEFDDLLTQVIERADEALVHQDYPFDLMIRQVNPARQANRQPLVNVIYGFQNFIDVNVEVLRESAMQPVNSTPPDHAIKWRSFDFSFATAKFDLTLFVIESSDSLRFTLEYDSNLFQASTIGAQLRTLAEFAGMIAAMGGD